MTWRTGSEGTETKTEEHNGSHGCPSSNIATGPDEHLCQETFTIPSWKQVASQTTARCHMQAGAACQKDIGTAGLG